MAENFTPGETISVNATTSGASGSFTLAQSSSYPDCLVTNAGNVITGYVQLGKMDFDELQMRISE